MALFQDEIEEVDITGFLGFGSTILKGGIDIDGDRRIGTTDEVRKILEEEIIGHCGVGTGINRYNLILEGLKKIGGDASHVGERQPDVLGQDL